MPPATMTRPSPRSTAWWPRRAWAIGVVACHTPDAGSKTSTAATRLLAHAATDGQRPAVLQDDGGGGAPDADQVGAGGPGADGGQLGDVGLTVVTAAGQAEDDEGEEDADAGDAEVERRAGRPQHGERLFGELDPLGVGLALEPHVGAHRALGADGLAAFDAREARRLAVPLTFECLGSHGSAPSPVAHGATLVPAPNPRTPGETPRSTLRGLGLLLGHGERRQLLDHRALVQVHGRLGHLDGSSGPGPGAGAARPSARTRSRAATRWPRSPGSVRSSLRTWGDWSMRRVPARSLQTVSR